MKIRDEFSELVKRIKENEEEFKITPRELINALYCERRSKGVQAYVNRFLEDNQLEVVPDFTNCWIDANITLKHKKKAKSKTGKDPIQRIKILPAANREPVTIQKEATLKEAVTLMMMHNYSQLPVLSGQRSVVGFISWETIGYGTINKNESELTKDYMSKDISILDYNTPLLSAISIILEKDFAIVQKPDKSISGIVTLADVSLQFYSQAEPFLLLEQIENHIRLILDGKFLLEELIAICTIEGYERTIEHIDNLTFGDYIRIIENPENWEKLLLPIERSAFVKQLNKIKDIRNDLMHFEPEGISKDQKGDLIKMDRLLATVNKVN